MHNPITRWSIRIHIPFYNRLQGWLQWIHKEQIIEQELLTSGSLEHITNDNIVGAHIHPTLKYLHFNRILPDMQNTLPYTRMTSNAILARVMKILQIFFIAGKFCKCYWNNIKVFKHKQRRHQNSTMCLFLKPINIVITYCIIIFSSPMIHEMIEN